MKKKFNLDVVLVRTVRVRREFFSVFFCRDGFECRFFVVPFSDINRSKSAFSEFLNKLKRKTMLTLKSYHGWTGFTAVIVASGTGERTGDRLLLYTAYIPRLITKNFDIATEYCSLTTVLSFSLVLTLLLPDQKLWPDNSRTVKNVASEENSVNT